MASSNYVKCSVSKIVEYQRSVSQVRSNLINSIEMMEQAIKKVAQSWQDEVFTSIKIPLQKSDARLQTELDSLKGQVMKRLAAQEVWLRDYLKTVR